MKTKILVVEDDQDLQELVFEYLLKENYTIVLASNGNEAKEIIENNLDIDLFILDIMLPFVSGLELLQLIRKTPGQQDKPVIMLTALQDEYSQLKSFEGLADDYITKPFSLKILIKRVEALLRRSQGQMGDREVEENITIDRANYEIYENNEKVMLTMREYELLLYLYDNKNRVLSREQLLNGVWGYDYFGDDRIIDAHIKNIRKKFEISVITTVKGAGYKFERDK